MTRRAPEEDGRTYWGARPDELAAHCVEHATTHGCTLTLRPDTPVVPDETFPFTGYDPVLTERVTWSEIETFVRHLGDIGCGWVNLRFAIEADGSAMIRYEAKPDGGPLSDGGIPACNGGFDCHRLNALIAAPIDGVAEPIEAWIGISLRRGCGRVREASRQTGLVGSSHWTDPSGAAPAARFTHE